jgi:hypothetical protein
VNLLSKLLVCTLLPLTSFAQTKAEWKAGLYGRSTDDSLSSSRTVGIAGLVHLQHLITDDLEARFLGGLALETGTSSSLFTNEFEPKTRLALHEASLRWRIFQPVKLIGGALEQRHHSSPLLIDGGTFPAAMISIDPDFGNWLLHVDGQAAIPTSRTLSTRSTGKEDTPTLYTQKIVGGWYDRATKTRALMRATHFQFNNLTRGMAQDSRFYGNEVVGIGAASRFFYQYEGFEAGPDFVLPLGDQFFLGAGGSYLQNTKGPNGRNQGLYGYTDFTFRAETFSLRPRFEIYRSESDSAPAFYTSAEFGHNNRKGTGAGLQLTLPKAKLEIELKARRGKLIEPRTFQRNQFDYLELSVELPYAGF